MIGLCVLYPQQLGKEALWVTVAGEPPNCTGMQRDTADSQKDADGGILFNSSELETAPIAMDKRMNKHGVVCAPEWSNTQQWKRTNDGYEHQHGWVLKTALNKKK